MMRRKAGQGLERVEFREVCEYPDGDRVVAETTFGVRDGGIPRRKDVVGHPPAERRVDPEGTGEENPG